VKNKICIIIPYYGKWPRFFDLYLKSCSYNDWLDILFITDLELPAGTFKNVSKRHIPASEIKSIFSEKLQSEVSLDSFYKLCDLKPTYGYVFQDWIKEYAFWGFGDVDLIYGNTRKFLTDELLDNYDIITFRTEWISGALTLFRNTPEINTLFKKSPDWKKVISSPKHFSFTEIAHFYNEVKSGQSALEVPTEIVSFTTVCKRAAVNGELRYFEKKLIKESISEGEYLCFDKGVIKDNKEVEYLHYHYITEKTKRAFRFPQWETIPDKFYITPTGFYTTQQFRWEPLLKWARRVRGFRKAAVRKLANS
jgi:hypothetical protein